MKLPFGVLRCEAGHETPVGPVYIEVKKRTRVSEAIKMHRDAEAKYCQKGAGIAGRPAGGHVVLVQHAKGQQVQYVTVRDDFFRELIRAWCEKYDLFTKEMDQERVPTCGGHSTAGQRGGVDR